MITFASYRSPHQQKVIVASTAAEQIKVGGGGEGVNSNRKGSLGLSPSYHQQATNNNRQKKNGSKFDLFTNIFKKKNKEKESESPPTAAPAQIRTEESENQESFDVEGEDKETSEVPTVTCTTTSSAPSTAGEQDTITSHGQHVETYSVSPSVIASQPIEIPLHSNSPMGHSSAYSDHHPFVNSNSLENTLEHYNYLADSQTVGAVVSISPIVSPRVRSLHHDMHALRMSRQDNPYLQQKLERFSMHAEDTPFSSPRKQEQEKLVDDSDEEDSEMDDDEMINLHEHLIRSPPPQFPQNVSHFRYPDTKTLSSNSVIPSSSPPIRSQPLDSGYDLSPANGRSGTPAYALDPNHPVGIPGKPSVVIAGARQKGSLPLLPIDEQSNPNENGRQSACPPVTSISGTVSSSELTLAPLQEPTVDRLINRSNDLNPIVIKSGVDILDPGMREVLEFQKHKIVHEVGLRLPEPLGTPALGTSEVTIPVITGRLSVDGSLPVHHHMAQRASIGSCSFNVKNMQILQPMSSWSSLTSQPPSTAPTFPSSPGIGRPLTLPGKSLGITSPPTAIFSPLPPLGGMVAANQHNTEASMTSPPTEGSGLAPIKTIHKGILGSTSRNSTTQ